MPEKRALHFPINVTPASLARRVMAVAVDLAQGDVLSARRRLAEIKANSIEEGAGAPLLAGDGGRIAPTLRARALGQILIDLATHGWSVLVESGQAYLRAPEWRATSRGMAPDAVRREKEQLRASVAPRVREQLLRPGTQRFIIDQERLHVGAAGPRSIKSLIADGPTLADALVAEGPAAIKPYLQVATDEPDRHTGLRLQDIYRYFRYFWSFPYYSTPGRTLPVLVRDAGQPNEPVCGLLCFASPVPKLTARDAALGLTPAWLEAVVLLIDAVGRSDLPWLRGALEELQERGDPALGVGRLTGAVQDLLGLEEGPPGADLVETARRMGPARCRARAANARRRLVEALCGEVEAGIKAVYVEGLGVSHAAALRSPAKHLPRLRALALEAREEWQASRSLENGGRRAKRRDSHRLDRAGLREEANDPLFVKKRAAQLVALLSAWDSLMPLAAAPSAAALAEAVTAEGRPVGGRRFNNGRGVSQGLRGAIALRLNRLMSAQVADVSVCGAIPPYGPLLGGKLAALLALSGEAAGVYFQEYDGHVSDIGSKMAGRAVTKPADLIALTTTSFYGVGSSQYNRVTLGDLGSNVRWEEVGVSGGNGTLHFSLETTELMKELLEIETHQARITSTFGEGPSERLRKVRDGMARLGLPADDLLQHGMPRRVYVAELSRGAGRPGTTRSVTPWRARGPTCEAVAEHWRQRWLGPRLVRRPDIMSWLREFRRDGVLLSLRLERADGALNLVSGGEE